jgi:hypothetical protein
MYASLVCTGLRWKMEASGMTKQRLIMILVIFEVAALIGMGLLIWAK